MQVHIEAARYYIREVFKESIFSEAIFNTCSIFKTAIHAMILIFY